MERHADYFVFPSVVRKDHITEISIVPRGNHAQFINNIFYTIQFVPMECFNVAYQITHFSANYDTIKVKAHNGMLVFSYRFLREQEWSVVISSSNDSANQQVFHIYAVDDDLYYKTPYKGDLHVHSCRSDGNEEPAIVAANYRKAGFDFMAITDHHRWAPSREAITAYKDVPINLKLFLGEEVHVPGNYIHMVNFGGRTSVNKLYEDNKDQYDTEIGELADKLEVEPGIATLEYAYRKWTVEQIRRGGGIAILVHPFWIYSYEYNMQTDMTRYMLKTGCFDAFELLGGITNKENNLQTALYGDLRAQGIQIPIVGSSDSHGTEPPVYFNTTYTVLLADKLTVQDIKDSISNFHSTAIRAEDGQIIRVDGTFRIVKYITFLLEHYFPRHDELCIEEGILMKNYICGDQSAAEQLMALGNQAQAFCRQFFGR